MKWVMISFVCLLLLLFFTTVKIRIDYKRIRENDQIHIQLSIWFGLLKLNFKIPMLQIQSLFLGVKVEEHANTALDQGPRVHKEKFRFTPRKLFRYFNRINRLRDKVHDFNRIMKQTLKKVKLDHLEWNTRVGVGDAAATGVITGVVWGVKSIFVGLLSQYFTMQALPRMNVVPAFQSQDIDTRFSCILRFRIGYAILAGTRIFFKLRKGREGLWQSTLFRA